MSTNECFNYEKQCKLCKRWIVLPEREDSLNRGVGHVQLVHAELYMIMGVKAVEKVLTEIRAWCRCCECGPFRMDQRAAHVRMEHPTPAPKPEGLDEIFGMELHCRQVECDRWVRVWYSSNHQYRGLDHQMYNHQVNPTDYNFQERYREFRVFCRWCDQIVAMDQREDHIRRNHMEDDEESGNEGGGGGQNEGSVDGK